MRSNFGIGVSKLNASRDSRSHLDIDHVSHTINS